MRNDCIAMSVLRTEPLHKLICYLFIIYLEIIAVICINYNYQLPVITWRKQQVFGCLSANLARILVNETLIIAFNKQNH